MQDCLKYGSSPAAKKKKKKKKKKNQVAVTPAVLEEISGQLHSWFSVSKAGLDPRPRSGQKPALAKSASN
jgi:hypothetical protein